MATFHDLPLSLLVIMGQQTNQPSNQPTNKLTLTSTNHRRSKTTSEVAIMLVGVKLGQVTFLLVKSIALLNR